MYFIGVDLGTSATKFLLMDEAGGIANITSRPYPVEFPRPGWSQQDPEDWWRAFVAAFRYMRNRISVFTALPVASLDKAALGTKLREIGRSQGATSPRPDVA